MDSPFFVSGITGQVGGAAARHLLAQGHKVRALSRDPQKAAAWSQRGVEVRQGDFTDSASIASALQGVAGAFLMIPPLLIPSPDFSEAKTVISSYQTALSQTPPPRVVLLSSVGSEKSSGLGNITSTHLMEAAPGDLPFPTAFVRAGGFIENYAFGIEAASSTGYLDSFMQSTNRPFPMIATADIGQQIAHLLVTDWNGKKIVELGSPLSPDDLARAMSEALGKTIQARRPPRPVVNRPATTRLPQRRHRPLRRDDGRLQLRLDQLRHPGHRPRRGHHHTHPSLRRIEKRIKTYPNTCVSRATSSRNVSPS